MNLTIPGDAMLHLTNAQNGEVLLLNVHHIVSVREDRGQLLIQTSTGVEYAVKETYDSIAKHNIWNRL